ncbi:MAG: hypothetical protein AB7V48_06425 [Sedimentibacter sp.]
MPYGIYKLNFTGSEGIFFMIILVFLFSILTAARIGAKDNPSFNLMIKLKKATSFILFLYPFKRKVTVWAVIMQVCNYITFLSALIVYKVLNLNSHQIDKTFSIVIGIYYGVNTILIIIDMIVFDIKNK